MIKLSRLPCPNQNALANGNYKHPDNKEALKKSSYKKCMYCESKIPHMDYGDVEHIKPKSIYPQLEFIWDNLGYACTRCNRQYKHDNYDVSTPFLNPFVDDPLNYIIASGSILFTKHGDERGDITITGLGLNRPDLIEKRQERINGIDKAIKACFRTTNTALRDNALNELKKEADDNKEYSFVIKALFVLQEIA